MRRGRLHNPSHCSPPHPQRSSAAGVRREGLAGRRRREGGEGDWIPEAEEARGVQRLRGLRAAPLSDAPLTVVVRLCSVEIQSTQNE